jgi:predicted dehydrogenase/nucleoside-diphosphate-sugar epimerase
MSLRVAFIGAGQMARNHVRALHGLGAVVVGVTDRLPERGAEFAAFAGTRTYPSIRALLGAAPDVVHVCTPPPAHFEAAQSALDSGAHVYVEKPFALTRADATQLLALAERRGRSVCAGHQLLFDPAFRALVSRAAALGDLVQADSHFAFRPPAAWMQRAGARALADQLVDVLPHPLYTLIAVLERFGPPGAAVEIDWARGGPADLQAMLHAGGVVGRLSVSLRARPIASSLALTGTRGSLTCDLVRSIVVGAGNPGEEALEKVLNPIVEGAQLMARTALSIGRRAVTGISYPGLAELVGAFYGAIERGEPSPVSPQHLLRVTSVFEDLVARIDAAANAPRPVAIASPRASTTPTAPLVVVTGARGFLGAAIARALDRVRGIGRAANRNDPHVHEWVEADLSRGVTADAVAGADVVVHAAAETAGDFAAHERNTIAATRHLLRAMHEAGVPRLVLVSSLSVLRPPRTPWERQNEATPRPADPAPLGPYTWGKSLQEELVEREAPGLGIDVRIVRPGALVDADHPSLPGLMGRHLFGRWHLGLGRSRLPIAVCDVRRCAEAIAWCATHFDAAPPVVNLFDPEVPTRGAFVRQLRARGWTGRIVWVPISAIAFAIVAVRTAVSLSQRRRPSRLAAWAVLKPRRYDSRIAAQVLASCR